MNFPVHFPSQLREHLKALRKARGLTQSALGKLLGVGQARIAEIENNPGVVSVDQLMKVLSALSVSMVLRDDDTDGAADRVSAGSRSPASQAPKTTEKKPAPMSALVSRSDAQALRDADPHMDVAPTSLRNFIIRPKKGSW